MVDVAYHTVSIMSMVKENPRFLGRGFTQLVKLTRLTS